MSDELGRVVRAAWVEWAKEQPTQKASWLVPYDELSEADKDADRRIGAAVAAHVAPDALLDAALAVFAVWGDRIKDKHFYQLLAAIKAADPNWLERGQRVWGALEGGKE